ncbi:AAA family ATPase [Synechococcus sp. A15-44]|uniref:AAA family ATPase n=1 Tax=Synechococcus sp. A15-44 TaxID=1050646 RepID=UPI00164638B3|nr:AAA family ATPase [Synechococcus sp. A15-44]QNI64662.1 recF/RecN/SMC N terminal domain protein [Synechococcus sp. A15-44]
MRLESLSIRCFRGIDKLELVDIPSKCLVLVGVNGSGKSSVLEGLAIILDRYVRLVTYSSRKVRGFKLSDIPVSGSGRPELHASFILAQDVRVGWSIRHKGMTTAVTGLISEESESLNALTGAANNPEIDVPLVSYYPVNRGVIDVPLRIRQNTKKLSTEAFDGSLEGGSADFRSFFAWFRQEEDAENEKRAQKDSSYRNSVLESVRNAIYRLLGTYDNLRIQRKPRLRMVITKRVGERTDDLEINQLSDGEKCLLALAGDVARRLANSHPTLPDPTKGSGIVLIDEVELHLHPKWQRKIIRSLRSAFPNIQFIVSTHSPQVLAEVEGDSIRILEPESTGIKVSSPSGSYGRDVNQILLSVLDTDVRPDKTRDLLAEIGQSLARNELQMAGEKIQQFEKIVGADDLDVAAMKSAIRRREILGR